MVFVTDKTKGQRDMMTWGGTQIWVAQGCATRASKPIPIFKGDFGKKDYPFLRISFKNRPIFQKFCDFRMVKTPKIT